MITQIPESWTASTFGELNQFDSRSIDPAQFTEEKFELYSVPSFSLGVPEFVEGSAIGSTKQNVEPNDVLICKINPRINRVWQVGLSKHLRQIASSEWIGFRSNILNTKFYRYFFSSAIFRERICADVTGVGGSLTRAQPKKVSTFQVPVAPLNEQKRIADKLDSILARVDACRERLDRTPVILKRFRQAVLAAATSGKLTEAWRANQLTLQSHMFHSNQMKNGLAVLNSVQLKKHKWVQSNLNHNEAQRVCRRLNKFSIDYSTSTSLPDNWCWAKLEDVSLFVVDCHNKTAPYESTGIALIRTSNIRDGHFIWDDLRFVSEATYEYWSRRCYPEAGDIVFTREAPLGEAAIIPAGNKICLGQRTMLIRTIEEHYLAKFLLISLMDPKFKSRSEKVAVGTGVKHFRVGDVSNLLVPVPSTEEQTEIVRRVEELFAYADRIEARYQAARARIEKLTPAVLAKAFRGELVPQDPNDEPARMLLERIRKSLPATKQRGRSKANPAAAS